MAATGVLASLAGCSQVPIVGDLIGGSAFYQDDLYAPGTVSDRDHYRFSAFRPAQMIENEDEFDDQTIDYFEEFIEDQLFDQHDIDIEDIETSTVVDSGSVTVIAGNWSAEDVVENLEDEGFDDESETDNGYQVLLNPGQQACTAVADEAIVTMHSGQALSTGPPIRVEGAGDTPASPGGSIDRELQNLRSISYGETVQSELDSSDPTGQRGFYEPVTFDGADGDVVTIRMASSGDTYLRLQDPAGNIVAENDDYNGLNSEITEYSLESSGEYTIIATSYSQSATFVYELEIQTAFDPDDMVSAVEDIVAVESESTDRYVDAVDAANELVNVLGDGTLVSGQTTEPIQTDDPAGGRIEDSVATGYSVKVNGREADLTAAAVFEDERDVDTRDVDDWVEEHSTLDEADDLSESEQGRVGVVTGVIDTDEL